MLPIHVMMHNTIFEFEHSLWPICFRLKFAHQSSVICQRWKLLLLMKLCSWYLVFFIGTTAYAAIQVTVRIEFWPSLWLYSARLNKLLMEYYFYIAYVGLWFFSHCILNSELHNDLVMQCLCFLQMKIDYAEHEHITESLLTTCNIDCIVSLPLFLCWMGYLLLVGPWLRAWSSCL